MSQAAVTGCITDMAGRGIGDLMLYYLMKNSLEKMSGWELVSQMQVVIYNQLFQMGYWSC